MLHRKFFSSPSTFVYPFLYFFSPGDVLSSELRRLCSLIRSTITEVCPTRPELVRCVLGNIFFLRFVCPALVLTQRDANGNPLTREVKRTLLIISKMLQNLVAGVEFDGTKERCMVLLNAFITTKKPSIDSFIQQLIASSHSFFPLFLPPSPSCFSF
jgi:hypothetical protein